MTPLDQLRALIRRELRAELNLRLYGARAGLASAYYRVGPLGRVAHGRAGPRRRHRDGA